MSRSLAVRIAVVGVWAVALMGGTALAVRSVPGPSAPTVHAVSVKHSPRVCRSAKTWGPAPDAVRPCVQVIAVAEDGSFSYAVSDADGTVRYTSGVGALDG